MVKFETSWKILPQAEQAVYMTRKFCVTVPLGDCWRADRAMQIALHLCTLNQLSPCRKALRLLCHRIQHIIEGKKLILCGPTSHFTENCFKGRMQTGGRFSLAPSLCCTKQLKIITTATPHTANAWLL